MKIHTRLIRFTLKTAALWSVALAQAFAQSAPPTLPPLPPAPPGLPPAQQIFLAPAAQPPPGTPVAPVVIPPPTIAPAPAIPIPVPVIAQPAAPANPGALVWDSEQKEYKAKYGEAHVNFTFYLTNISSSEVVINSVRPSCGCTTAKLPPMPWHLTGGTNGQIDLTINLAGKSGTVVKSVTVDSTAGVKSLIIRVDIPTTPPTNGLSGIRSETERAANMQSALADRQAIFKGDCAKCHVEPTVAKVGKDLYSASCGICHEAEHRATMVPDLKALPHPTNADYWKLMITSGKPGTLMPAFAIKEGGNLTDEQIASLVQYLVQTIPANPQPAGAAPKSAAIAPAGIPPNTSTFPLPKAN